MAASNTGWAGLLMWFVLVLALIPVSLWLLKRSRMGQGLAGLRGPEPVKVLHQTALGQGQRLVLVSVGQGPQTQHLLVGVTPQHIQLVHTVAPGTLYSPAATTAPAATHA